VRDGYIERDYLHCDILAVLVVFKWCPEEALRTLGQAGVPVPPKGGDVTACSPILRRR
jgi:hypothetical protein